MALAYWHGPQPFERASPAFSCDTVSLHCTSTALCHSGSCRFGPPRRTWVSGVRPQDVANGRPFDEVIQEVSAGGKRGT